MTLKIIRDDKNGLAQWHVIFDSKTWKKHLVKTENELLSKVEIPGFRKGKVPVKMAKKNLTIEKILQGASKTAINIAYDFALNQKTALKPVKEPEIKIAKITNDECEIVFTFDLPVAIIIGEYCNLQVVKPTIIVSKIEIETQIKALQDRFAILNPKEGILDQKDIAFFDFTGFLNGEKFPGGEGKKMELEIGSGKFIPGFEEGMIGMKAGEKRTIEVNFPEEYHVPNLKGKLVQFEILLHEIKVKTINENLTELIKDVNIADVTNETELKEHIKKQIEVQKTMNIKENFMEELISKIVQSSKITIPNFVVKAETERLEKEFKSQLAKQNITIENYFAATGLTEVEVQEEIKKDAIKQLQNFLVIEEIIKKEKIEVNADEVEKQLLQFSEQFKISLDEVKKNIKDLNLVTTTLRRNKAFDLLWENNGKEEKQSANS